MKLTVLGSGSSGNCYLLQDSSRREALVIEAGIPLSEVKRALGWKVSGLLGVVVSHRHEDHAKYVADYVRNGIRVMAPEDVLESKRISKLGFTRVVEPGGGYRTGGFRILAFPVLHDVPCLGFVISHDEMGSLLFVTDSVSVDYAFPPMEHIMIEANYAEDIAVANVECGRIPASLLPRLHGSHMELGNALRFLREADLSECRNIVLIHLSSGNSDEGRFVREAELVSGMPVCAARKGLELCLDRNPF